MKAIMLFVIKFYRQCVSPFRPPCCRFYPTCSAYAQEAIVVHGAMKGGLLALCRILKCHPFHKGGYDPVPPCKDHNHEDSCCQN